MATTEHLQKALQKEYDKTLFAKEVLFPVFGSAFTLYNASSKPRVKPTKSESTVIDSILIYAGINLDDGTDITCYEVILQPTVRIEQSKVAIQQYVRKLLLPGQAALINFVSPKNKNIWRFTLVAKDSKITDKGIEETQTHPQRYTFLVEKHMPNRTMAERLSELSLESGIDLEKLITAFSVEAMSKAFFNEYKEHYQNFLEYLTGKRMVKEKGKWVEKEVGKPSTYLHTIFNSEEKDARDFVKKLMGRIVFLYFVQKKRWLGATTSEYNDGPYDFIFQLFEETGGDERFFPLGLSELFFNALNHERPEDNWQMPSGRTVKIPFLNGGLFVRDEIDEKIHDKGDMLTFPPGLFSHVDKKDTPNDRGFLDFLNAYNFTVYENSEHDHTVAVDPEMLGHIFENLLEDNKDKGAFYTPKEIVAYMCQESLIEYLTTHLSKEYTVYRELGNNQIELFGDEGRVQHTMMEQLTEKGLNRAEVEQMVKTKDINNLTGKQLNRIDNLLDSVRICDPAIGSGAFPMGLLQEIYTLKEAIANKLGQSFDAARTKENIIQHSIYGVDIERGAVDIAQLRFWLSLVVDEEKPKALPNLDYKIVVGNSLVSKFNGEIVEINWDRISSASSGDNYVKKIRPIINEIAKKQFDFFKPDIKNKKQLNLEIRHSKLELLIQQLTFDRTVYLQQNEIRGGFLPSPSDTKHNLEREQKILNYNNLIKKLQKLKENPEEPFEHFDWRLDFPEVLNPLMGEKVGFDIVIANPPYIKEYTNRAAFDGFRNSPYFRGKMDIWYGFACKSIDMIKNEGIECFIAQNNWITSAGASILREKVLKETEIKLFTDFCNFKVFKTAGIQTMIYVLKRIRPKDEYTLRYSILNDDKISVNDLNLFLDFNIKIDYATKFYYPFQPNIFRESLITFNNPQAENILRNIQEFGTEKLLETEIAQGIVAPQDKLNQKGCEKLNYEYQKGDGIFLLSNDEKKKLALSPKEKEIVKPFYSTAQLKKYYGLTQNDEWIIYTNSKANEWIHNYPQIKAHLSKFKKVITSDFRPYGLHRSRDEKFFKGKKIMSLRKSSEPTFTYTDFDCYVSQSYYVIKTNRFNLKSLTGILNSNVIKFWLKNKGKMQGEIYQVDKVPLIEIPIPIISNKNIISRLVSYIITLNLTKTNKDKIQLFEKIINAITYELYFPIHLKKRKISIIGCINKLPKLKSKFDDEEKLQIIKKVYKQLSDINHPLNMNLKTLYEIPEIALIEGEVNKDN